MKNFRMPLRFYSWCSTRGAHGNLAQEIKEIVNLETESEIHEYYKRIVGIEKDYRLSKVAKVSAFMYGQPDIQILC